MRTLLFLVVALMIAEVYSSHYRGGTFYWERHGKAYVRVFWRLSFQRNFVEYACPSIGDTTTSENDLALTCTDCTSNRTILQPLPLKCRSVSEEMGWSILDGYVDYKADRNAFTMEFKADDCTWSSWVELVNYGFGSGKCWSLITTVDTTTNNNSPRLTTGLPVYRVRQGCKRLIDLNPIDIDGDPTKCRWANDNECPGTRNPGDVPVCGQATENAKLYRKECKLEFNIGKDESTGWYGASVMIEDFADTSYSNAKSTVPFQFLLDVTTHGSCIGPKIDVEECIVLAPGQLWEGVVRASIQEGSDGSTITEIQSAFPDEMTMTYTTPLNRNVVEAKLTFQTTVEGTYRFIFTATDNNGVQDDPVIGNIIVTKDATDSQEREPLNINNELSIPVPAETFDAYEDIPQIWVIKFDSEIARPDTAAFIRVKDVETLEVVAKYNVLHSTVEFPVNDPTAIHYPAPTELQSGATYMIEFDDGVAVKDTTSLCGLPGEISVGGGYPFIILPPPEPTVDCGDSQITAYIPKYFVNDIPASELHLHDPRCVLKNFNDTFYRVQFSYDECGTIIKSSTTTKTKFYNNIRDDAQPVVNGAPVTRKKRQVEIKIICEMTGLGVSDVIFIPDTTVTATKYKSTGQFKTYLSLYLDSSYNDLVADGTVAEVPLKQKLYFSAKAVSPNKEVAIENCRAMAKDGTCTENDKKYLFIDNGCATDSTVSLSSSGLDHRFSIKSFAMLQYASTGEVVVKCKMVTCKPGTNSRCSEIKSGNCSRRRRATYEDETDTFMTFRMF